MPSPMLKDCLKEDHLNARQVHYKCFVVLQTQCQGNKIQVNIIDLISSSYKGVAVSAGLRWNTRCNLLPSLSKLSE